MGMVAALTVLILNPEHKDSFSFAFLIAIHILQHKYMFPEFSKRNIKKKPQPQNIYNCPFKCVLVFAAVS